MIEYRKRYDSDTWHWCTNCSQWPASGYVSERHPKGERPSSGELHNECRTKEREGECKTRS